MSFFLQNSRSAVSGRYGRASTWSTRQHARMPGGVSSTTGGGTALFIRQLSNGARPRGSAYFYSKLSHLIDQRRTRQSKPIGGSVLPSDQPVRLIQYFQDMLPIGVGKRA